MQFTKCNFFINTNVEDSENINATVIETFLSLSQSCISKIKPNNVHRQSYVMFVVTQRGRSAHACRDMLPVCRSVCLFVLSNRVLKPPPKMCRRPDDEVDFMWQKLIDLWHFAGVQLSAYMYSNISKQLDVLRRGPFTNIQPQKR